MKIDFLGRYREVSQSIRGSSAAPTEAKQGLPFSETLRDLAPQFLQQFGTNQEKGLTAGLLGPSPKPADQAYARLNLASPTLSKPTLEQLDISELEHVEDKKPTSDVKTPTVLSIERKSGQQLALQNGDTHTVAQVRSIVESAGEKFGVDPVLGMAVVAKESSFNPTAVSSDGHESKGLFQLLDRTGRDLLNRLGLERKYDPFDPEQNVYLGVGYLKHLHDIFSKETELNNKTKTVVAANNSSLEKLAVAAFNAGEGRVASAQQRALKAGKDPSEYDHIETYLPESTQQYVSRVIEAKSQFAASLSTAKSLR